MEAKTAVKPLQAITREKEIKGWRREKKDALVAITNPEWKDLSTLIFGDDAAT